MAHCSRRRPAAQDIEHTANASNGGRDRSPVAVHAPHWDNSQPLTNWYRDQLMAKIEELHHPRRAQLRRARVSTLVKALQELGFDPSAEHNGGNNQQHGEQSVSARAPLDTLVPIRQQLQQQVLQQQLQQQKPQRLAPTDQTSQMRQNGGLTNELEAKIRDGINQHLAEVMSAVISMVHPGMFRLKN